MNVVRLSEDQSKDIDVITNVIKELGEQQGCPTCCSGEPLNFEIERLSFDAASRQETKRYRVDKDGKLIKQQ
jgi:hypothetical protein